MPFVAKARQLTKALSQYTRKIFTGNRMPIYALDDVEPELPPEGEYWVAPTAVLVGRVRLLKGASIWWGAVLRGDNEWITIGENSNVQDLSVLHTDPGQPVIVGSNCTIGHRVIVHSANIGDGSLVGMGSTLLNRSRIGTNCLVGANTLVTEGKEFGDRSMILGSPARVTRQLNEMELAMLKMSSAGYVHNHQRFRDGLRQVG